jgi:hypothetical protein
MKPWDFPLRSRQSRAAARLLLTKRHSSVERKEIIIGSRKSDSPHATEWDGGDKNGVLGRIVNIPEGMTIPEGLRLLGGYSEYELERIAEKCSEPITSCSLYSLRRY